jgi:mutator protein MutT
VALQRELREELGFEAEVGSLFEEVVLHYPEKSVRLRFFRCAIASGEPRPIECAALAWVDPAQLGQYAFPPADAQLIERLSKGA